MNKSKTPLPENAVYTGRGTTALWAILNALDRRGADVMLPVNICEIVIPVLLNAGLRPAFYDVDPNSGNTTIEILRASRTARAAACIVVHNFGTPLEIGPMAEWAAREGLFLIEDACNALGAAWRGRPVGTFGDASIFSFGHAKIVAVGAGGALHVRDREMGEKAKQLLRSLPTASRVHKEADVHFQSVLRSLRLNPIAQKPSIYRSLYGEYFPYLLFQPDEAMKKDMDQGLTGLEANLASRRKKAALWRECLTLATLEHRELVEGDAVWRYTFLAPEKRRNGILEALSAASIPASKWYPPVHTLFDEFSGFGAFPGAESFASRCINVFVDESVSVRRIRKAAELIQQTLEES
ncbi:MAG: DegT/DnrJ/EryC1/StrS family aminotransferase [Thermodesulfobacteriota bacterium]